MISVSEAFAAAASDIAGDFTPALFLDIYADTGPRDEIASADRWSGTNDPLVALDTNVDANRKPGSIMLAPGASVAPVAAGADVLVRTLTFVMQRTDRYHYKGALGKLGGSSYGYDGASFSALQNDTTDYQEFTAAHTQIIDDLIVSSQFTGTQAMPVWVRIISADTGNQVGNAKQFTPGSAVAHTTLSGFSAGIVAGRTYYIRFDAVPPTTIGTKLGPPSTTVDYTCSIELYAYSPADATWRIPYGNGTYLAIGGRPNFQPSGYFARRMDVGEIPVDSGELDISDVVPNGCAMSIETYFTDSATVAAETSLTSWTLFSKYSKDGMGLTAHRYWAFAVTMTASAAGDLSPELLSLAVRFTPAPLTYGTTAERTSIQLYEGFQLPVQLPISWTQFTRLVQTGYKALDSVSAAKSQLTPQFQGAMTGGYTATLDPEDSVDILMSKYLKGKRVDARAGFLEISDTFVMMTGAVDDLRFENYKWTLMTTDLMKLAKVQVPTQKAGNEWDAATAYAVNDVVVYGTESWICTSANTGNAPASGSAYWSSNGTVWLNIDYTPNSNGGVEWHAADVILDLLTNQINIPSRFIDFSSIAAVKALFPTRTVTRLIDKPTDADTMLGELAWLLESQFVERGGLFALVADPPSTTDPVEHVTPVDIIPGSVKYRRGWKELVNQAVIISGYTGQGNGQDKFTTGEAVVDATSQTNYDGIFQQSWQDKWNMPSTELVARAQAVLDRYKDGRRAVAFNTSRRLWRLEPGDVVTIASAEFPPGDPGPFKVGIVGKQMDWAKETYSYTALEV